MVKDLFTIEELHCSNKHVLYLKIAHIYDKSNRLYEDEMLDLIAFAVAIEKYPYRKRIFNCVNMRNTILIVNRLSTYVERRFNSATLFGGPTGLTTLFLIFFRLKLIFCRPIFFLIVSLVMIHKRHIKFCE